MEEEDIVAQIIEQLEETVDLDVDVRTTGGDRNVAPPEVILDYESNSVPNYMGHTSFAGYVTNDSGEKIGVVHHDWYQFSCECRVRYLDDLTRDRVINDIQKAFYPYLRTPESFDSDTTEWDINVVGQRQNMMVESDWYEASAVVEFYYVKAIEQVGMDALETINSDVEVNESLEGTSTEIK